MGIIPTWKANAKHWIDAIEQNKIISRQLATNRAIVEEVLLLQPRSVLDMGCGEGWLVRTLATHQIQASGVDAVPAFIEYARQKGTEQYWVASYEDILAGALADHFFDVITFNFSLFEQQITEQLLAYTPQMLCSKGCVIIQTLHPFNLPADAPYVSHWEQDNWQGLNDFSETHAWYFRTISDWVALIVSSGFRLIKIREPLHPSSMRPLSFLLVGEKIT
ncbi:MAG: methyltransferase domain-containing protein [Cytophagales bacterium]|nr:methyltransferase domain-containing protein [Bernardetiaceae bacterium]MDW8204191.1 methyltransferase domain-containing protein [Cytophagales bacterium]